MIQNIKYYISISVVLFLMVGCKDRRMIPEKDMGDIIVQVAITESYIKSLHQVRQIDSVDVFLPILDEYGYTMDNFNYTLDKMVRRKSNVLSSMMDKLTEEVKLIKAKYEYINGMGRKWKKGVRERVIDTLYFSPDSIIINSLSDLDSLTYRVPVFMNGELIVSFNYRVNPNDKSQSRYMKYRGYDSLNRDITGARSHYWLSRNQKLSKFEKEIIVSNAMKNNMYDINIFSYTSSFDAPMVKPVVKDDKARKKDDKTRKLVKTNTPSEEKEMDVYIDNVTICFRPNYEVADKIMLKNLGVSKMLYDIKNMYNDSTFYVGPFREEYSKMRKPSQDSIRVKNYIQKIIN